MRRFVIGDIHGCAKALRTVLETIDPQPSDELVFLGDYIDRGSDTPDVIDQILDAKKRCKVISLRGNHEIMLVGVVIHGLEAEPWFRSGGHATITSYGGSIEKIPQSHLDFFQTLRPFYETDQEIFVHAGYVPDGDLESQDDAVTYWEHLPNVIPPPHRSGKRVFVGHTPQANGEILDGGHLVCVDTCCFGGGYLTALEVNTFETIQCDLHGHLRRSNSAILAERWATMRRGMRNIVNRLTGKTKSRNSPANADNTATEI